MRNCIWPRQASKRSLWKDFSRSCGTGRIDNETARRIMGSPAERTFYQWKKGRGALRLPGDTLRRIGYVAGIWKALQIVYSNPDQADSWVNRPNTFFGGQTPLQRMAAGDVTDLAAVRAYIDAARGPWS